MQLVINDIEKRTPLVIHTKRRMSDAAFWRFCQENPNMRIERRADGEIIVMPPTGWETGFRNQDLTTQLGTWARKDGRGRSFDSSTGYSLPDGSALSPDASWVSNDRIKTVTPDQKRKFAPLCPDFVVELMSPSDQQETAEAKMEQWIANGAQLGWLLDPDRRTAYLYRPGRAPEKLVNPKKLKGEAPVAGFVLDLTDIWAGL